jgi:hypothetical protein
MGRTKRIVDRERDEHLDGEQGAHEQEVPLRQPEDRALGK